MWGAVSTVIPNYRDPLFIHKCFELPRECFDIVACHAISQPQAYIIAESDDVVRFFWHSLLQNVVYQERRDPVATLVLAIPL